jgi:hypothetical protein
MKFDHVAINVVNIDDSIKWYLGELGGEILYQDETWGLISTSGVNIAFTLKSQHPPHICFEIDVHQKNRLELKGHKFKKHRDGSFSTYVKDINNNYVEYLFWPRSKKIGNGLKKLFSTQLESIKEKTKLAKKLF